MKTILKLKQTHPRNTSSQLKSSIEGIPYKLLNEVAENARIYKHLVTIAIIANLMIVSIAVLYIDRA